MCQCVCIVPFIPHISFFPIHSEFDGTAVLCASGHSLKENRAYVGLCAASQVFQITPLPNDFNNAYGGSLFNGKRLIWALLLSSALIKAAYSMAYFHT